MAGSFFSRLKAGLGQAIGQPDAKIVPPDDLRLAAEAGDAEAQADLGRWYAEKAADSGSAETWFTRAVEQGLPRAMHNIGVLRREAGHRVEAEDWFLRAAQAGWLNSLVALAMLREEAGDIREALTFYNQAAEAGHAVAQYILARKLIETGREEHYASARRMFERAAANGEAAAKTYLGTIYHEGLGVERDPEQAAFWFLEAAREGHPGGQFMIGCAYHLGVGVALDRVEAAWWLTQSKAQGNELADIYFPRVEGELTAEERSELGTRLRPH
jgi:uncharacterized protein